MCAMLLAASVSTLVCVYMQIPQSYVNSPSTWDMDAKGFAKPLGIDFMVANLPYCLMDVIGVCKLT